MKLSINISGMKESERLLSLIMLGSLVALEEEIISIDEAEAFLFNPYIVDKLKELHFSNSLIDIINEGCELEDLQSLIPERLLPNIKRLKKELSSYMSSVKEPIIPSEKIIK